MKIYADVRALSSPNPAGVARYINSVLHELSDNNVSVIGIGRHEPYNFADLPVNFKFKKLPIPHWLPESFFIWFILPFFVNNNSIYLGLNHCIPIWGMKRRILFIHDFVCFKFPDTQIKSNSVLQKIGIILGLRRCTNLVSVSNYTREVYRELFPKIASQKDAVIISNIPKVSECTRPKFAPKKRFILSVGSVEPRKNLVQLIHAFEKIRMTYDYQLIIVGGNSWKTEELERSMVSSDIKSEIIFTGYLPDSEVTWYMRNCQLFSFPSLYEGFGIPPFEALLNGAKVVGTTESELKYFGHLRNLVLFDPHLDDLATVMQDAIKLESASVERIEFRFDRSELIKLVT